MSSNARGKYRGYLLGQQNWIKCYRETERRWGIVGNALDAVTAVYKGVDGVPSLLDPADYDLVLTGPSYVKLNTNPGNDANVYVHAERSVDVSGEPTATQYPGALLRYFLHDLVGVPYSRLPSTSFSDFDTDFPIECRLHIPPMDEQITAREIVDEWQASFFAHVLCDEVGAYEVGRYNPSSIPASVATINEDDIIEIEQFTEGAKIYNNVTVPYLTRHDGEISNQISADHPTAASYFANTEPFSFDKSMLVARTDAGGVCDLYLAYYGADRPLLRVRCVASAFKALPTQWVTIVRTKGFSSSGSINAQFKVRDIKKIISLPGTCELIVEPSFAVTSLAGNESTVTMVNDKSGTAADTNTATITLDSTGGDTIVAKLTYTMSAGDPDIWPTSVKWNGVDLTEATVHYSSTNVRSTIWTLFAAAAGEYNLVVVFPANFKTLNWSAQAINGAATVGATAEKYQATGKVIQGTVAAANGNLVVDAYACESAPVLTQHTVGSGQTTDFSRRTAYSASYTDADALTSFGTHKNGATSVVMKHTESVNSSKKAHVIVVLEP